MKSVRYFEGVNDTVKSVRYFEGVYEAVVMNYNDAGSNTAKKVRF